MVWLLVDCINGAGWLGDGRLISEATHLPQLNHSYEACITNSSYQCCGYVVDFKPFAYTHQRAGGGVSVRLGAIGMETACERAYKGTCVLCVDIAWFHQLNRQHLTQIRSAPTCGGAHIDTSDYLSKESNFDNWRNDRCEATNFLHAVHSQNLKMLIIFAGFCDGYVIHTWIYHQRWLT